MPASPLPTLHRALHVALLATASSACGERTTPATHSPTSLTAAVDVSCPLSTTDTILGATLVAMHRRNPVPGISAAVVYGGRPDSAVVQSTGRIALEPHARPLVADDRMLAGSVGKTFWAALALTRHASGQLDLDVPVSRSLGSQRLPAFAWITPRMLLRHTSGVGEYDETFMRALIDEPRRARRTRDWLDVLRRHPPVVTDTGKFRYSDLNYVVLAMVLERGIDGQSYRDVADELLTPLHLEGTVPSVAPQVARLIPGFDGAGSMFGRDAMMVGDSLIYDPQFEWGGGGFASTPGDLARWMTALRLGHAFPGALWPDVVARPPGIPDSARRWRGMGVHVDVGSLGTTYGHSGYMPGYVSWMRWYERDSLALAMQVNATDSARLRDDGFDWMDSVVVRLRVACPR